jgi:tripartite-type tricarboxylate transporter receptor subunit TctC
VARGAGAFGRKRRTLRPPPTDRPPIAGVWCRREDIHAGFSPILACLYGTRGTCSSSTEPTGFSDPPDPPVAPYPAGGATDVVARIGAGTMIGASAVARSAPDGYMMLIGDTGTYALNPTLYDKQLLELTTFPGLATMPYKSRT